MNRSLGFSALIACCAVAWLACGGGGDDGTTPPSPPPATTTTITPIPGECSVDLAQGGFATQVFGSDDTDYLADRFSLAAGDFNGDGFDDALIGAPLADGPGGSRLNSGEAYILFGSASLPQTVDLVAEGSLLTIYGGAANDNLGLTVVSGDPNGDGIDDIVVGARFASPSPGQALAGETYVIFGRADLAESTAIDTANDDQDVTIGGIDGGDFSGISLAASDVTGDGIDDIIIGAIGANGPTNQRARAGETYVVLGSRTIEPSINLAQTEPFFTVYGAFAGDSMPNYISAGDINDDGRRELVLGAPAAENGEVDRVDAGETYIIPVPEGGGSLDLGANEGFTRITGAAIRDRLGHLTATGDVNGDGIDDVVMGTRDADGPQDSRNNAGEVHVLFGRADLPASIDLSIEQADLTIFGPNAGDSLGFTVATGDLNGDGISDILAGAPLGASCENSRSEGGEIYAIYGSPDLPSEIDLGQEQADLAIFGPESGDELGFSIASGDFNGDGKDDVLAGALLADGPSNDRDGAGEAYIVLSQ